MKLVVQRVSEARVTIDGETAGEIGRGYLVLVGVGHGDDDRIARELAAKLAGLRIFPDESGKTNRSVLDVGGAALVVSQFTLYADTRKGRRPSFTQAAAPEEAARLVDVFRDALVEAGVPTATGRFGADMRVSLVNDGPFTLVLEQEPEQEPKKKD